MATAHEDPSKRSAHTATSLAATVTCMAADRTLMAWIRTALSLFGFGLTIYKVLQVFEETGGLLPSKNINTPWILGLLLTGTGTLAILMATIQYVLCLREFTHHANFPLTRPPLVMAVVMSVGGVVLFVGIISRIL